jgi:hypothetical protein
MYWLFKKGFWDGIKGGTVKGKSNKHRDKNPHG